MLVYHKSSKHNEPNEWVEATIEDVNEHILTCLIRQKGPPMEVAHEYVRLIPTVPLTRELMMKQLSEDDNEKMKYLKMTLEQMKQLLTLTSMKNTHMNDEPHTSMEMLTTTKDKAKRIRKNVGQTEIGQTKITGEFTSDFQRIRHNLYEKWVT